MFKAILIALMASVSLSACGEALGTQLCDRSRECYKEVQGEDITDERYDECVDGYSNLSDTVRKTFESTLKECLAFETCENYMTCIENLGDSSN